MKKNAPNGVIYSPSEADLKAVEYLSGKKPTVTPSDIQKKNEEHRETIKRLVDKKMKDAPSAAKAACDQIADRIRDRVPAKWVPSFEYFFLGDAIKKDARAKVARSGNTMRVETWHAETRKLVAALWKRRPTFRGNADKTAKEIHVALVKHCEAIGVKKPPQPRTIARFISTLKG